MHVVQLNSWSYHLLTSVFFLLAIREIVVWVKVISSWTPKVVWLVEISHFPLAILQAVPPILYQSLIRQRDRQDKRVMNRVYWRESETKGERESGDCEYGGSEQ